MADILFLFDHGHLVDFTPQEIVRLVRALFADSPLRNRNIEKVRPSRSAASLVLNSLADARPAADPARPPGGAAGGRGVGRVREGGLVVELYERAKSAVVRAVALSVLRREQRTFIRSRTRGGGAARHRTAPRRSTTAACTMLLDRTIQVSPRFALARRPRPHHPARPRAAAPRLALLLDLLAPDTARQVHHGKRHHRRQLHIAAARRLGRRRDARSVDRLLGRRALREGRQPATSSARAPSRREGPRWASLAPPGARLPVNERALGQLVASRLARGRARRRAAGRALPAQAPRADDVPRGGGRRRARRGHARALLDVPGASPSSSAALVEGSLRRGRFSSSGR